MSERFTDQIRAAFQRLAAEKSGPIELMAVARELDLPLNVHRRKLYVAMRDFIRRGEVERIKPGLYRYIGLTSHAGEIQRKMWRLIRARKSDGVTYQDLVELCGASPNYAREYLRMLTKRGVLKRIDRRRAGNLPSLFRLINDPGPAFQANLEKAAKLRRLRRQALERIDAAFAAVLEARQALLEIEEE